MSTSEQAAERHHSIPVQLDMARRYAAANDLEVVAEFRVEGESAYTDYIEDRPEFDAALRAAERGEFGVLLIRDMTRFARDQYMAHASLRRLRLAGVALVGVLSGVDYVANPLLAGIEAAVAEDSSRALGSRIAGAKARRYELGLTNGDIPFGYRRVMREDVNGNVVPDASVPMVPNEAEAEAVRWAYRAYAVGGTYLEIAQGLSARGLTPHSKRRGLPTGGERSPFDEFSKSGIQRILENPVYLGYVTHHGQRRRGLHEAIIDQDLWDAAQARRQPRGGRGKVSERMLSGMVRCARCHRPLVCQQSGSRIHYYRERRRGLAVECEAVSARGWPVPDAEREVEALIRGMTWSGDWLEYVDRRRRGQGKASAAGAARRVALEEERRRAAFAHLQGALTDEELAAVMGDIARRRAALPPDVDSIAFAARRLTSVAEAWDQLDTPGKRRVVREALQVVELDLVGRSLAVQPRPEYLELFEARRVWARKVVGVRPAGVERAPATSDLYCPADLAVGVA